MRLCAGCDRLKEDVRRRVPNLAASEGSTEATTDPYCGACFARSCAACGGAPVETTLCVVWEGASSGIGSVEWRVCEHCWRNADWHRVGAPLDVRCAECARDVTVPWAERATMHTVRCTDCKVDEWLLEADARLGIAFHVDTDPADYVDTFGRQILSHDEITRWRTMLNELHDRHHDPAAYAMEHMPSFREFRAKFQRDGR